MYYDSPDPDRWEVMKRKRVVAHEDVGLIHIVISEIPPFSRYAVAYSR